MKANISLRVITEKISVFFARHHFIIFFTLIGAGLITAAIITNVTILSPQDDGYVSGINGTGFDETTIERLRSLNTATESSEKLDFSGRISPF